MIRKQDYKDRENLGLPRMRGDDPCYTCIYDGCVWFAPHARG